MNEDSGPKSKGPVHAQIVCETPDGAPPPPEIVTLQAFLYSFSKESDRGSALVASAMLDERLKEILSSYFIEGSEGRDLLSGFNAPLGTFSARASAAAALGLIHEHEFAEITIIRKIRNEFGHSWSPVDFENGKIAALVAKFKWPGPLELEKEANNRSRFNMTVGILMTDLIWRVRLVKNDRCKPPVWGHTTRPHLYL